MALTYLDIKNEVKRRAIRDQSGTEYDSTIGNVVNSSLFRIGREALWRQLRRKSTITTTASREEYNLPIQASHRSFLWHEIDGFPQKMEYVTDQEFYGSGVDLAQTGTPVAYRMWGENMVITQPTSASVVTIASSSSTDTSKTVTVFGTVSGYPDYEIITTDASNGTTSSAGSKSFSAIERIVKSDSTTGRITATSNSGAVTVAVLPVGDTTSGILYKKIQVWPLPQGTETINVQYYKDVYRLVNDGDVHELGQDFDEALILLSVAKIKYQDSQKEGDRFIALYQDEIKSLKRVNVDKIDHFKMLRKPGALGGASDYFTRGINYSQLGGNYGPISWN